MDIRRKIDQGVPLLQQVESMDLVAQRRKFRIDDPYLSHLLHSVNNILRPEHAYIRIGLIAVVFVAPGARSIRVGVYRLPGVKSIRARVYSDKTFAILNCVEQSGLGCW